eukprot:201157-Hanusia_phi.AAC.1
MLLAPAYPLSRADRHPQPPRPLPLPPAGPPPHAAPPARDPVPALLLYRPHPHPPVRLRPGQP